MRFSSSQEAVIRWGSVLLAASSFTTPVVSSASVDTYDYVVVGSGPGGGPLASNLARAGFKTLLLEAGEDESNLVTTRILPLNSANPDRLTWSYYVRHHDDLEQDKKYTFLVWRLPNGDLWVGPSSSAPAEAVMLGVQYPRGATLGGSSIVNAGLAVLPSYKDWDNIKKLTGDSSWSAAHMAELFIKLEKNQYRPRGTPGHGHNGYLELNMGNGSRLLSSPQAVTLLQAMASEAGQDPTKLSEILNIDPNNYADPLRDQKTGLTGLTFHANGTWARYAARERVLDTIRAVDGRGQKRFPLELRLNSFVTKILFDTPKRGSAPRAIGLEYREGKSLYQGDTRYNSTVKGTTRQVFATKEVIVSAGSFGTPQLLLLSGIGPAADLKALNISVVADLPGVGRNMQDHNEIAVIGAGAQAFNFSAPAGYALSRCFFGAPGDPCIAEFLRGEGPYAQPGLNSDFTHIKTNHTIDGDRDIGMFSGPFAFRGLYPSAPNLVSRDPPSTWGIHGIHMHGTNRNGYLKLRSTDPTVTPEINFRYFSDPASTKDVAALKEFIAWGRRAFARVGAPVGPFNLNWPTCPGTVLASGACSVATHDEDFIRTNTFGHHVTSTCAIGPRSDKFAVVDSKFRVHGVAGLRIIDASTFPTSPGSLPVLATYILSEKGAETILTGK